MVVTPLMILQAAGVLGHTTLGQIRSYQGMIGRRLCRLAASSANLSTNSTRYTEPGGRGLIGRRRKRREIRIDVYDGYEHDAGDDCAVRPEFVTTGFKSSEGASAPFGLNVLKETQSIGSDGGQTNPRVANIDHRRMNRIHPGDADW